MTENTGIVTENTATDTVADAPVADVVDTNTAVDILGGTDAAADATTPGKAARKRNGEKRDYTPRGTTYWARRVILLNGEPVGRGRPSIEGKGERKVVYVPDGMEYDVAVHGEGVKYNTHSHRATHKRIAKDSVSYTFDDGVAPAKANATKTKAKTKTKAAKATKGDKGKSKGKTAKTKAPKKAKAKDVTVPVADVAAAVDTAPAVEIPASTDAVTA
jgi:hypothetical protein